MPWHHDDIQWFHAWEQERNTPMKWVQWVGYSVEKNGPRSNTIAQNHLCVVEYRRVWSSSCRHLRDSTTAISVCRLAFFSHSIFVCIIFNLICSCEKLNSYFGPFVAGAAAAVCIDDAPWKSFYRSKLLLALLSFNFFFVIESTTEIVMDFICNTIRIIEWWTLTRHLILVCGHLHAAVSLSPSHFLFCSSRNAQYVARRHRVLSEHAIKTYLERKKCDTACLLQLSSFDCIIYSIQSKILRIIQSFIMIQWRGGEWGLRRHRRQRTRSSLEGFVFISMRIERKFIANVSILSSNLPKLCETIKRFCFAIWASELDALCHPHQSRMNRKQKSYTYLFSCDFAFEFGRITLSARIINDVKDHARKNEVNWLRTNGFCCCWSITLHRNLRQFLSGGE